MIKTSSNIPIRVIALLFLLFTSNAGLALGTNTMALTIAGIPVIHFVSAAIIAVALPRGISKLRGHNPFLIPIRIILFLIAVSAVFSVYEYIFSYSAPLENITYNIFKFSYVYLVFFPIIIFIKNEKELIAFLKGSAILALVAGIAVAYQFIFNVDLPGSVVYATTTVTRSYRIMYPAVGLILGAYVFLLSLVLSGVIQKKQPFFIGFTAFCGLCSILSMHRTLLVTTVVITLWMLFFTAGNRYKMKSLLKGVAVVMISIAMFIIMLIFSPAHLDFEGMYNQTVNELSSGTNSLYERYDILSNVYKDVIANYPLLGKGFNYYSDDFNVELRTINSPTNDSGINNILLCFGFTGICAFVILLYHLFRSALRLIQTNKENRYAKAFVYGCIAINIVVIMIAIASDVIMGNTWTSVMVFSWAILYLLYQFSCNISKSPYKR
jgi:hypothetical protein